MNHDHGTPRLASLAAITLALVIAVPALGAPSPSTGAKTSPAAPPMTLTNPPAPGQLIQPAELAKVLADTTAQRPVLLHVGIKNFYKNGHIPGSQYYGPASEPAGLESMKKALQKVPRQKAVVLYCGCCPWTDCPNVHPAYQAAREMGFKNVRVLYITKNLPKDWIDKGLPTVKGDK
jgi:rhodanese-related sulfurtransferase